jgi:hypothetical protein
MTLNDSDVLVISIKNKNFKIADILLRNHTVKNSNYLNAALLYACKYNREDFALRILKLNRCKFTDFQVLNLVLNYSIRYDLQDVLFILLSSYQNVKLISSQYNGHVNSALKIRIIKHFDLKSYNELKTLLNFI